MELPEHTARLKVASEIMRAFADRTGLSSEQPVRRYLWTDAFAVCNFLALYRATRKDSYRQLALALIDQVHEVLGHHRPDDPRRGWISGLPEEEGRQHPTAGGLRIGKPLPERGPDEPFDAQLEWERDGQYYHYLTKWVHALSQAGCMLNKPEFLSWANELAHVANRAFIWRDQDGQPHMHWKMRIDLGAPLVASMGQHDPLDGLVTCLSLKRASGLCPPDSAPDSEVGPLDGDIRLLSDITRSQGLETDDPLGLGGLLFDAGRLIQNGPDQPGLPNGLTNRVLQAALTGIERALHLGQMKGPANHRLAFRELGLAIGLALPDCLPDDGCRPGDLTSRQLKALTQHRPLRNHILRTWLAPQNRKLDTWTAHEDINSVMLATGLVPDGFLVMAFLNMSEG